ncbi:MAG: hypothetical protein JXR15_12555 [Shimia sp.]|uniref:DUF5666 domain-containing protein n=1 Tax=Shimia sagamensis TaxID=1566352 RepID=A0ABY1PPV7_9RHOB|nr:hypothetical protein [Shimia sagamensis]SMP36844.1 hypothetical protein SAMN06265373_1214 [Shimia sagamensis]
MADANNIITGGKITPQTVGAVTSPTLSFKGKAPKAGEEISFVLDNGVTYSGKVSETLEEGGEVLVVFHNGIKPQK